MSFMFLNQRFAAIRRTPRWSTAMLILSSAALGGIAVALWNRKALSTFRDFQADELQSTSINEATAEEENEFY
jgi:hypothetical protein